MIARGGRFALTPFYDLLSAAPFLGSAQRQLDARDLRLAMAVRGKNAHWRLDEIQRRHWCAVSQRAGLGNLAEQIIIELLDTTPTVLERVAADLPDGFPDAVATPILDALRNRSSRLADQPAR